MTKIFFKAILIAVLSSNLTSYARNTKVQDVFQFLPAGQIKLTNYFENDIQNSIQHWNKGVLPYAKLVDVLRNGRPTFAVGEMWGKAVRSGSLFYRYTHDGELRQILKKTIDDVLTTVRCNGSISCDPIEKQPEAKGGDLWERKYTLLGLGEYYKSVDKDPRVLKAMINEAQNIIDEIGEYPKTDINTLGWSVNKIESSSLLEPFVLLYETTGEQRFLDFATYIVKHGGCQGNDIFQEAIDNVPMYKMAGVYPKAYEMTSIFEGLAEYYRVTGIEKWKTSFMHFYNNVCNNEITLIGNGGADEPYHQKYRGEAWDNTKFEQSNPKIQRMMETCVGVTWMKFCTQIVRLTGNSQAVDEIERYIYNGLLGAMKPTGDGFSYVNLLNGRKVTNVGWGWKFGDLQVTCCNLNGPIGLAYIPLIDVMQAKEGPVINLYNSAQVTAKTALGYPVMLNVQTEFPKSDRVNIQVNPAKSEKFTLRLRIPQWSKNTQVSVNGRYINRVKAGGYLCINQVWKKKDNVEIKFDMHCQLFDAPKGSNPDARWFQAVQYGPIVLSRDENTDSAYNKPIKIIADSNHEVKIQKVSPILSTTRMEFIIPTTTGNIHMIDYSSVNGWKGKKICTWLPILR